MLDYKPLTEWMCVCARQPAIEPSSGKGQLQAASICAKPDGTKCTCDSCNALICGHAVGFCDVQDRLAASGARERELQRKLVEMELKLEQQVCGVWGAAGCGWGGVLRCLYGVGRRFSWCD